MPAAVVDYNPMPYYFTPEDQSEYGDEYPLRLTTSGRISVVPLRDAHARSRYSLSRPLANDLDAHQRCS